MLVLNARDEIIPNFAIKNGDVTIINDIDKL